MSTVEINNGEIEVPPSLALMRFQARLDRAKSGSGCLNQNRKSRAEMEIDENQSQEVPSGRAGDGSTTGDVSRRYSHRPRR